MKNYQYIQSLLGFGAIKIIFFSLTIYSFVGCEDNKVVSEKKIEKIVEIEKVDSTHEVEDHLIITDINLTKEKNSIIVVDKNLTTSKDIQEIKKTPIVIKKEIISTDPLYNNQWYLNGKFGINVSSIWANYSGRGISVAVVDSGIEATHPDLQNNVDLLKSLRYEDGSSDPSPSLHELRDPFVDVPHGTAVAGIIGAEHNDIGISGIAYETNLIGLNVFSKPNDSSFEDAMGHEGVDISSNSWGADLSFGLDDDRVVLDAIVQKMQSDPTIYIFASGNEQSNSDFSSVLNSRYTLVIGATKESGEIALYSNYGSNVLCVAPGGEDSKDKKIVTTDLMGDIYGYDIKGEHFDILENQNYDYSSSFYGTSASVPMVSGVVALMLEANKNLSYRDIKYILAHSCRRVDTNDSSWIKNSASLWSSNYYGFGLIDANRSVEMAKDFIPLSQEIIITKELNDINLSIPDNNISGVEQFFEIDEDIVLEYASLIINTNHVYSGDLKIVLNSPTTSSILAEGGTITEDLYNPWEFGSLRFMDEMSKGKWNVKIIDTQKDDSGVLNSLKLILYGHKK